MSIWDISQTKQNGQHGIVPFGDGIGKCTGQLFDFVTADLERALEPNQSS
jgi:hypothetical protein